jgi:hypothetical protein
MRATSAVFVAHAICVSVVVDVTLLCDKCDMSVCGQVVSAKTCTCDVHTRVPEIANGPTEPGRRAFFACVLLPWV